MSEDDSVEKRLTRLEQDFEGLLQQHRNALGRIAELEDDVESLQAENDRLREDLAEQRDLNTMLKGIQQSAAADPETRAAIIVQNMFNEASARERSGQSPVAVYDKDDCRKALGGDAKSDDIYYAMREAVPRAVDGDVVEYVQTPRGADQGNHLELDLRTGELAGTVIAGHTIRAGGEVRGD